MEWKFLVSIFHREDWNEDWRNVLRTKEWNQRFWFHDGVLDGEEGRKVWITIEKGIR